VRNNRSARRNERPSRAREIRRRTFNYKPRATFDGGQLRVYASVRGRVDNLLEDEMKPSRKIAIIAALFTAIALPTIALAQGPGRLPTSSPPSTPPSSGSTHPAPAPLIGAGLPVIAVGYGAYWLVRRYRRKSDAA
jgi:hypothetical protein